MNMKVSGASEGSPLGKRQRQVLVYVCKGFNDREIAGLMGVRQTTIADHIRRILIKMGASTRSEAAYQAGKSGLVA